MRIKKGESGSGSGENRLGKYESLIGQGVPKRLALNMASNNPGDLPITPASFVVRAGNPDLVIASKSGKSGSRGKDIAVCMMEGAVKGAAGESKKE